SVMKFSKILIRYGDIALKSKQVRGRMERILKRNIELHLKLSGLSGNVILLPLQGRLFVETRNVKRALEILRLIPGIVSFSPCIQTSSSIEEMKRVVLEIADEVLEKNATFAIRVRRSGKHEFNSQEFASILGEHVLCNLKNRKIHVDLTKPEKTIHVEIRDKSAFFFNEIYQGIGGFPVGTQSKLVALLFKSAELSLFSAFLMMRKGCKIIPLFFEDDEINWKEHLIKLKKFIPSSKMKSFSIYSEGEISESDRLIQLIHHADKLPEDMDVRGIIIPLPLSENLTLMMSILSALNTEKKLPRFFPLFGIEALDLAQFVEPLQFSETGVLKELKKLRTFLGTLDEKKMQARSHLNAFKLKRFTF
ncbi:MAG: THUMP domain-containing protein, partial [Candidatus Helarchaeales archaeon]